MPAVLQSEGASVNKDSLHDLKLVPTFNEKDPEVFFTLFERLSGARGWSDLTCVLLLQCALTGRAQEVCSALANDNLTYKSIKSAVLKAYELVPEAYHFCFRGWKKEKSH